MSGRPGPASETSKILAAIGYSNNRIIEVSREKNDVVWQLTVPGRPASSERRISTPISQFMSTDVYTVPRYDQPHIAARVMRNHHLHHVVVTEDKLVVGMVSSFDLLRLVEEHRFTMKQGPTPSRKPKRAGRTGSTSTSWTVTLSRI